MSREEFLEAWGRYMASPEWDALKWQVYRRGNGQCERCHNAPIEDLHHLTYRRRFHERLDDLQGICHDCHTYLHRFKLGNPSFPDPIHRRAGEVFVESVEELCDLLEDRLFGNLTECELPAPAKEQVDAIEYMAHEGYESIELFGEALEIIRTRARDIPLSPAQRDALTGSYTRITAMIYVFNGFIERLFDGIETQIDCLVEIDARTRAYYDMQVLEG